MSKHWRVRSSEELFRVGFFRLRVDSCDLPDGRHMPKYFVVEFPTWIHVVAITSDRQMVLVKQYRHAAQEVFYEVPGGSLDPRLNENPLEAAQRELREETGYTSENWLELGAYSPNPALQNNLIVTFLARDCAQTKSPEPDAFEDIEIVLRPVDEVYKDLVAGEFKHALMMSTLIMAQRHL